MTRLPCKKTMHGSLFVRQKRTVRTLSQPKFFPDMKAKELLETIQSNAIKCFDYMKENNAIL